MKTESIKAVSEEEIRLDTNIFSEIDLNLMVTFLVIYEELNVSRTADKLGVTQPAVSNALVRLRAHFNDVLFERTRGGVKPTPRAEVLCNELKPAMNSIQLVLNRDRFIAHQRSEEAT
ncbi:LysR family transcriptional regulator [Pseudomonas sp. ICMP 561]|uniref:LysR family transcriptional regulator n=1 Tax=Pseudomonas sp. ICMP 561 TaxID=1718918 RepID=UPI000C088E90|nr:LysR family transcriptional regulator [Pseudomonas sp. ICMP 561]PHN17195.1 hypothetical protein AO242_21100 [Pseudomonas sp. ICMP 561]